jgi:hypothetical protein
MKPEWLRIDTNEQTDKNNGEVAGIIMFTLAMNTPAGCLFKDIIMGEKMNKIALEQSVTFVKGIQISKKTGKFYDLIRTDCIR